MSIKYVLWAKENTPTTGTGDIGLGGAATGFVTFGSQLVAGDQVVYSIVDGANRELGVGTYQSGGTLARTTIRATLEGGSFALNPTLGINLSGSAQVFSSDDATLLTWAEGIRKSTGKEGEILVVGSDGIAALSDTSGGPVTG